MKEILKILKKYTLGIILIVILLVVQANCDLALPEYTSNIINIGIQQKGVEESVANAYTENTLNSIVALSNDASILDYFELIESDSDASLEYIDDYPYLKEGNIYVKKELSESETAALEEKIVVPQIALYMIKSSDELAGENVETTPEIIAGIMASEDGVAFQENYANFEELDSALLDQYAISSVIDEYTTLEVDLESRQMNYLFSTGIKMIALAFLIMAIIILSTYLSGRIASMFSRDLRSKIVSKVMSYSNSEFNQFSTSSLITRSTNDVQQIQMLFTMLLRIVLYAPIIGIGALVKVAGIDMVWVIGIAVGAIMILVLILLLVAMPKFRMVQKLIDKINLVVREVLNGLPVIRAFANEEYEIDRFDKSNRDLMKVNLFTQRTMALMSPVMMFIMNGICVLIYWVGADAIDIGTMQVGTLTALITYTMQIIMAFLMLSMISIMAPRAMVSINRVSDVLTKDSSILEIDNPIDINPKKRGEVEFRNVSFQYPDGDELVLENISFKVKPGTTTAIIGSTGSGKSTIVNLIPRFFDVTEGEILVDGVNIKNMHLKELRDIIGVVPQKGLLFSGTIESNIKFADKEISDEQMKKAARVACADTFIAEKEDGYASEISQGGTNVSGGQRQRLAIARAVAKDPEIYIFDDSFSALDYKTDSMVRKNLAKECSKATKIIVAQRVSTVMNADQIIVLDEGKVVGIGTHKNLYKKCKIYKEIALSQLKEEELA